MVCAYLDAFSGLSGDMTVGALLDAGADFARLKEALGSLGLSGYGLGLERRALAGISAAKFKVEVTAAQPERHLAEIRAMIEAAALLAPPVKAAAISIFTALAEAEAKVHRTTREQVHFHEVGAVDSIIDIVGAAWCLAELGVTQILVSPMPAGRGFVKSQHGTIPVPAPATTELLNGFPIRLGDGESEMVTPTGAAIVRALGAPAPLPIGFCCERIGYGAGSKTFADRPNVLRLMLGRMQAGFESDQLLEIQTNIDDLNPQLYDYLCARLMAAGARDVTLTPTIMKKGRPGVIVSVLAETAARDILAAILFEETTTIGLRFYPVTRLKLAREVARVATRWGEIGVKVSRRDGYPLTATPEYDDCARAAAAHKVPLKLVIEEAMARWRAQS